MAEQREDFYNVLGIARDCSSLEIRSAYKKLAMRWHPDKCQEEGHIAADVAKQKFQSISEAYKVLSDAETRGKYDRGELIADDDEFDMESFMAEMAAFMMMAGGGLKDGFPATTPFVPPFQEPVMPSPTSSSTNFSQYCAAMASMDCGDCGLSDSDFDITDDGSQADAEQMLEAYMAENVSQIGPRRFLCMLCDAEVDSMIQMHSHFHTEHITEAKDWYEEIAGESMGEESSDIFAGMGLCKEAIKEMNNLSQDTQFKKAQAAKRSRTMPFGSFGSGISGLDTSDTGFQNLGLESVRIEDMRSRMEELDAMVGGFDDMEGEGLGDTGASFAAPPQPSGHPAGQNHSRQNPASNSGSTIFCDNFPYGGDQLFYGHNSGFKSEGGLYPQGGGFRQGAFPQFDPGWGVDRLQPGKEGSLRGMSIDNSEGKGVIGEGFDMETGEVLDAMGGYQWQSPFRGPSGGTGR